MIRTCRNCSHDKEPAHTDTHCNKCLNGRAFDHHMGPEGWEPIPAVSACSVEDPTNPAHYREFPVEVIQIVRHLNFNRGNAVKYVCRAGRKNLTEGQEVEDLRKAIWYLEDEIQRLTGEGTHASP